MEKINVVERGERCRNIMVVQLVSTCMLMNVRGSEGWFANGGRLPYGNRQPFLRYDFFVSALPSSTKPEVLPIFRLTLANYSPVKGNGRVA